MQLRFLSIMEGFPIDKSIRTISSIFMIISGFEQPKRTFEDKVVFVTKGHMKNFPRTNCEKDHWTYTGQFLNMQTTFAIATSLLKRAMFIFFWKSTTYSQLYEYICFLTEGRSTQTQNPACIHSKTIFIGGRPFCNFIVHQKRACTLSVCAGPNWWLRTCMHVYQTVTLRLKKSVIKNR